MTHKHVKATIKDDVIVPKTHLNLPDGTEVEVDVDVPDTTQQKREFGSARGKIKIVDNFDDPLPGFSEYRQ